MALQQLMGKHTLMGDITTIYGTNITLRGKRFHTEGVNVTHGSLLLRKQIQFQTHVDWFVDVGRS